MSDPRITIENRGSSVNLNTKSTPPLQKTSSNTVDTFNTQGILTDDPSMHFARDAVANTLSAAALGASATYPASSPNAILPKPNLSLPKSFNAIKLNPIALGASALLYSSPLGGDSFRNITPNLRLRISDDASTEFEKRINGNWQATGVSATPVFDNNFKLVAFQGLSLKDANLVGLPTTFPIRPQPKPAGGFEVSDIKPYTTIFPANEPNKPIHTGHASTHIPKALNLESPISDIEQVTLLESRRYEPGIVEGKGQPVGSDWMREGVRNGGAPIPEQIADKLRGKEFATFDKFREAFWNEVANDPKLSKQFSPSNRSRMDNGKAPFAPPIEQVGDRQRFEIHHIEFIKNGGDVYNVDNLKIMTPKAHIKVHNSD